MSFKLESIVSLNIFLEENLVIFDSLQVLSLAKFDLLDESVVRIIDHCLVDCFQFFLE